MYDTIIDSCKAGSNISHGIPVQIAKQDKTETRAIRSGIQNVQQSADGQTYEIIQQADGEEHDQHAQGNWLLHFDWSRAPSSQ